MHPSADSPYGSMIVLAWVSVASTVLLVALSVAVTKALRRRPWTVNVIAAYVVIQAFFVYSRLIGRGLFELGDVFAGILDDGTFERRSVLLFWVICVVASLIFGVSVAAHGGATTTHRKFFHLTASLICLSGAFHAPQVMALSALLMLCIFVILELLRVLRVPPWADTLDGYLLAFSDGQDGSVLLTPLFLLTGMFLPFWLSPINPGASNTPALYHFAGLITVGVGDSAAALVGSRWGRTKLSNGKSVQGSGAMLVSQLAIVWILRNIFGVWTRSWAYILLVCTVSTSLEAALTCGADNIALPVLAYFLF